MARPIARPDSSAGRPRKAPHPLGSLFEYRALEHAVFGRAYAVIVFSACVGLLGVALWLQPSPSGMGTHQQLGLPPCVTVMMTGYPCPSCGMTTAFSHAVRGQLLRSFHAQPAGLAAAILSTIGAMVSLGALLTGRVWTLNWYRVSPARLIVWLLLLIVAGWAYKLLSGLVMGALPAA